jgi:flagellar biosynthesis/type III secretory pathway protein FliH
MYITIEENIRIEFDRFYSAMKFNTIDMPEGLRDLLETLEANIIQEYEGQLSEVEEEAYEDGYNSGKDAGYDEGYDEGKDAGHDDGYSEGYNEGYEEGFEGGYEQCGVDNEDE